MFVSRSGQPSSSAVSGTRFGTRFARRTAALGVALATVLVSASAWSVTVEFAVPGDAKGREQRIANQAAQAVGAAYASRGKSGTFSFEVATDAQALATATALRERASVLWAKAGIAEAPLSKPTPEPEYHGRMLALNLRDGVAGDSVVERLATTTGQKLTFKRMSFGNRALMVLPAGTSAASLAAISVAAAADPSVKSVERVRMMRHQWMPNDTMLSQQWSLGTGIGGIRAQQAWDLTPSGSVVVAVIDTGIRSHPDLDGKLMSGYDMIRNEFMASDGDGRDGDASDPGDADYGLDCSGGWWDFASSWHGTHVAGIIAASTNNGQGIAGVAPNARIVSVRTLGRCGGTDDDVADSIRWAAGVPVAGVPNNPNPAKVLNLSLGGHGPCSANQQDAVNAAIARGATVVVAAGNDSILAADFSPANCSGVVTVAASNLLGDLSSYSNFGNVVKLSAPGGDSGDLPGILSTLNGGITAPAVPSYATYMGTSMAAPHVAGVVALMLTRDPTLTPGQVMNRLQSSVHGFPAGSDCAAVAGACGSGLLDAANAVAAVTPTRAAADVSGARDRVKLIELRNDVTGRHLLSADPVEIMQLLSGQRGGSWSRTGQTMLAFSDTSLYSEQAIPQPVCRARYANGGGFTFSSSTEICVGLAHDAALQYDGMMFAAAMPTGWICPIGSTRAFEMITFDGLGRNVRTLTDPVEVNKLVLAGWINTRIAFCAPQ